MATNQDSNSNPTDSSSLKRKRPPTLEIPSVLRINSHPHASKLRRLLRRPQPRSFLPQRQEKVHGRQPQDVFLLSRQLQQKIFGVYDGHGGRKAAEFVAENLHNNVLEMMKNCTDKDEAVKARYLKTNRKFLKQGGYVKIHRGARRVHGLLTVNRSIGDAHLKDWVIAKPETKILQLTPDMEFLILASDGLWEKVVNQEAVDTVRRLRSTEKKTGSSRHCLKDNDSDNTGCVNVSPSSKLRRITQEKI